MFPTQPMSDGSPLETDLRARLASDRNRPQYHFLPPANWLNDPNGAIQWQGQYHLFYQYNPNGPFWGDIHWGHAVSPDLVHWQDLPIALTPSPDSADADGCWSGFAVNDNGVPTLIYTGLRGDQQRPCLATSADQLITWQKYDGNPIIPEPPAELGITGFRDHCLWQEDGVWYQVIGAGLKSGGGAALLYTSTDLRHWQYLHPLASGDFGYQDEVWECPDFFELDGQYFLAISSIARNTVLYQRGDYTADRRFTAQSDGRLDLGNYLYAPQSFKDDNGRRIMWGWLKEGRSENAQRAAGWSGVMSLPLVPVKQADGNLGLTFADELHRLRGEYYQRTDLELAKTDFARLDDIAGDCLEIVAEFEPGDTTSFGLIVRATPDEAEQTRIVYDNQLHHLAVDRTRASLDPTTHRHLQNGPCALLPNGRLRLHVYLDRSVIEISANDGTYLSSRIYPTRNDGLGLGWFANGGRVRLVNLEVWQMTGIW